MTDEEIIHRSLVALYNITGNGCFAVDAERALNRITQRLADYEIAAQARTDRIAQLEAELAALEAGHPEGPWTANGAHCPTCDCI